MSASQIKTLKLISPNAARDFVQFRADASDKFWMCVGDSFFSTASRLRIAFDTLWLAPFMSVSEIKGLILTAEFSVTN